MIKGLYRNPVVLTLCLLSASINLANADILTAYQAAQKKDYKTAAQHFEHCAHLGLAKAQKTLAQLYIHGAGVEKDLIKAYVYFSLANEQQPSAENEKHAKAVFAHLSAEQQQQALEVEAQFKQQFGKQHLAKTIEPELANDPFVLTRGKRISSSKSTTASQFQTRRSELTAARFEFDVAPDGTVRDIDVIQNMNVTDDGLRNMLKQSYSVRYAPKARPRYKDNMIMRVTSNWANQDITRSYVKERAPKLYRHIQKLEKLAEQGNANAQYDLATYIMTFPALQTPKQQSAELIESAAKSGHPKATTEYAMRLIMGKYTDRDVKLGVEYLTKAAKMGDARAQYRLGRELLAGQVVEQNNDKALFWLQRAVESGDENAKFWLARILVSTADATPAQLTYAAELLDQVKIMQENNPNWHYYNAQAKIKQNKARQAVTSLETAIEKANAMRWKNTGWNDELVELKKSA